MCGVRKWERVVQDTCRDTWNTHVVIEWHTASDFSIQLTGRKLAAPHTQTIHIVLKKGASRHRVIGKISEAGNEGWNQTQIDCNSSCLRFTTIAILVLRIADSTYATKEILMLELMNSTKKLPKGNISTAGGIPYCQNGRCQFSASSSCKTIAKYFGFSTRQEVPEKQHSRTS